MFHKIPNNVFYYLNCWEFVELFDNSFSLAEKPFVEFNFYF